MDGGQGTAKPTLAGSQSIFVLELVSSGYFGDEIGPSFRAEGRAMLDAVIRDLQRIPGLRVDTPQAAEGIRGLPLNSVAQHTCDAALIIAPEFDGLLEQFSIASIRDGCQSLNCHPSTIRLCGDKWRLYQHLQAHRIPTIPTERRSLTMEPSHFPVVVKPRDGAGSWLVNAVNDLTAWRTMAQDFAGTGRTECLCQPCIAGTACSIAVMLTPDGRHDLLPIAEQKLSDDGEFRYLGGRIPARISSESALAVQELTERCLNTLPGLRGYVGFDVIVPTDRPTEPLLVEINPRLTTSYIGYQRLCRENLMERMLVAHPGNVSLRWHDGGVEFDPHGQSELTP